jgi:hypothetical protein
MEGKQNSSKNAIPFANWINEKNSNGKKNVEDRDKFCSDNFIPTNISYDFGKFNEFYSERKKLIVKELFKLLTIKHREGIKNETTHLDIV